LLRVSNFITQIVRDPTIGVNVIEVLS